ncbi:MAG: hypothetical protein AAGC78_09635 [Cellvibrio sp.]|uniref:TapB family protein n=1 Tax=Cellvibrio sp. TaxID=1965322 RepID=UPI0031A89284
MRVNISPVAGIIVGLLLVGCGSDDNKKKPTSSFSSSVSSAAASSIAPSSTAPSSTAPSSVAASSIAASSIPVSSVPASSSEANSSAGGVPASSSGISSVPASSAAASSVANVTLTGTAAVGAAIVNGTVIAKCANGSGFTQTVTTNAQGAFSGSLPLASLPCALQIAGGTPVVTLHSYALTSGTVNITPLTDLLIASASTQLPSAWFQSTSWQIDSTQLQAAQNNLKTVLTNATYSLPAGNFDPFTISFQIGDAWDQLLDQLQAAIDSSSTLSSYADLLNLVKDGNFNAIPPKATGGGSGTGNAASCFNPDVVKQGTHIVLNYKTTDGGSTAMVNFSSDIEVKGSATFNGKSAVESASTTQATGDAPSTSTTKSYLKVDNNTKRFSYYGSIVETTAPIASSSELTITPERIERFDLAAGESYTQSYSIGTKTVVMGFPVTVTSEHESTVTFKGTESVTVPAGTFNTCRFETSTKTTASGATSTGVSTTWITVNTGVSVRTEADGDVTELVSGTINGNAIK